MQTKSKSIPNVLKLKNFGWCLIFYLLVSLNPSVSWGHKLNEEPFNFEIVGTLDTFVVVPMFFPPNYTGTIPPADVTAYESLVGRVFYTSTSPCKITSLILWQGICVADGIWNRTQHNITPPPGILSFKSTFDFSVEVTYSDAFLLQGKIFLNISTSESGDFILSTSMPYPITQLNTLPLFLLPSLLVIFLVIIKRNRNGQIIR